MLPCKLPLLLSRDKRVADIGSILEQACAFRDFDNNLYLVNVAGACHVGCPVKFNDGIDKLAALELYHRKFETVVIVGSSRTRLAELPIISLRINDLRTRIQILITPGEELVKKKTERSIGTEVRSISTGIVLADRVAYLHAGSLDERLHPGEVIIEICLKIVIDALVIKTGDEN